MDMTIQEILKIAAIDTVLGMGTTFAILILLALVITVFGAVMNRAAGRTKKADGKVSAPKPAAAPVKAAEAPAVEDTAEPAPGEDELIAVISAAVAAAESDGTLTAVMAAAVAAYEEDSASVKTHRADEYVARTIRKSRKK